MRNATKRKGKIGLSALAVASLAAWAGDPVAHAASGTAAFTITPFEAETDVTYGGGTWDVWVLGATRTDMTGTDAGIDLVDVTINSPVPLGIEIQKGTGSGVNIKYSADVDGGQVLANGVDATFDGGPAAPAFGDIVGGTFIGVGQGPYLTDYTNNPQITQAGSGGPGVGINGLVFANSDIDTPNSDAYLNSFLPPHTTGSSGATLSSAFISTSPPVSGSLNNGNVTALNVIAEESDPGTEADGVNGPVPFANIVVPTGTVFTVHGEIGPSSPDAEVAFSTVINTVSPPPPPGIVLTLTGTQLGGTTNVGTATVVGSNGRYQAVTVGPFTATGTGNLTVDPFSPNTDGELYGIAESGATSLTQLISDLNNTFALAGSTATAEVPTGAAGSIFTSLGENLELVFPSSATPGLNTEFLNWSFANYTGNGTVVFSKITVLPEPTGIGALVLGGAGLLSRRRKSRRATV